MVAIETSPKTTFGLVYINMPPNTEGYKKSLFTVGKRAFLVQKYFWVKFYHVETRCIAFLRQI
jgi:hypothetical protein